MVKVRYDEFNSTGMFEADIKVQLFQVYTAMILRPAVRSLEYDLDSWEWIRVTWASDPTPAQCEDVDNAIRAVFGDEWGRGLLNQEYGFEEFVIEHWYNGCQVDRPRLPLVTG
jgi:hypothetical protein